MECSWWFEKSSFIHSSNFPFLPCSSQGGRLTPNWEVQTSSHLQNMKSPDWKAHMPQVKEKGRGQNPPMHDPHTTHIYSTHSGQHSTHCTLSAQVLLPISHCATARPGLSTFPPQYFRTTVPLKQASSMYSPSSHLPFLPTSPQVAPVFHCHYVALISEIRPTEMVCT